MNLSLTKNELRAFYKAKRMALSQDEVNFLSQKLLENFILQFNVSENQNIHIFLPISKFNEINTFSFIKQLWEMKINVFVPKIHQNKIISVKFTPQTLLKENSWGILEPVSSTNEENTFDYIITPLLYCDKNGNRIGYGKGFYDQFFKTINAEAKKIGVNYFPPIDMIDDVSENDVQLDYLVAPDEILSFFSGTSIFTK